jgi:Zn-dependent peptidase ImmA (M78 family)
MKIHRLNAFTDEWFVDLVCCTGKQLEKLECYKKFELENDRNWDLMRGYCFVNAKFISLIWINSTTCDTKVQKLLTLIHEVDHITDELATTLSIKSWEWHAETLEYIVKQGMKVLKLKI